MSKDKRIDELPGITPSAVVGLTRDGVVTVADLLAADFDRVAYLVDDYNEASRLMKEAAKEVPGSMPHLPKRSRSHAEGPGVSTPVVRSPLKSASGAARSAAVPAATAPRPKDDPRETILSAALDMAVRGLSLGPTDTQPRATLKRRLSAACLLLEHGADEPQLAAAMLLEPAEAGAIKSEEISRRFGAPVERLLDECASLRAVPMLPSGKLPRYYLEMAGAASLSSRRICAAYLLSSERRAASAWHARLLSEGLSAGEADDLITLARKSVERLDRSAA